MPPNLGELTYYGGFLSLSYSTSDELHDFLIGHDIPDTVTSHHYKLMTGRKISCYHIRVCCNINGYAVANKRGYTVVCESAPHIATMGT